jgi:hypothetical protein
MLRLVYLDLDTQKKNKPSKIQQNYTEKKLPQTFSISPTAAAVILNYFLWPFAIIKSSFEPFVYSARLFLLLIDFSLHIMGIQDLNKRRR